MKYQHYQIDYSDVYPGFFIFSIARYRPMLLSIRLSSGRILIRNIIRRPSMIRTNIFILFCFVSFDHYDSSYGVPNYPSVLWRSKMKYIIISLIQRVSSSFLFPGSVSCAFSNIRCRVWIIMRNIRPKN